MRSAAHVDSRAILRMPVEPRPADVRCTLECLGRLLARGRRLRELGLCGPGAPCAWHLRALDRAIVSYLVLAEDLGVRSEAERLLAAHGQGVGRVAG